MAPGSGTAASTIVNNIPANNNTTATESGIVDLRIALEDRRLIPATKVRHGAATKSVKGRYPVPESQE